MYFFKKSVFISLLTLCTSIQSQVFEHWIDQQNNSKLILNTSGQFQFSNNSGTINGIYSANNNILTMQDIAGNYYQYHIQNYSKKQLVLIDSNGTSYNYLPQQTDQNSNQKKQQLPWMHSKYNKDLIEKNGLIWTEKHNQIYIEFLQLLIGQTITKDEAQRLRIDFQKEFEQDPVKSINEIQDFELAMTQVYSLNNVEAIALVREQLAAEFYKSILKQPELKNYEFVKILNKYVTILSIDQNTNLSLSNQDVQAYINYLQFQAMLMGQSYQISQQDRMTLQMQLSYAFNSYPLEQKQALAFASFQWNVIATQWSQMDNTQQQQYISQVQSQLNIQNSKTQTIDQDFWNQTTNDENQYDFASVEQKYRQEAEAKGMNMQQYLDFKQRDMATNQQLFTMMQNMSTENHVMMMNTINNIGDSDIDYYYVDYNN